MHNFNINSVYYIKMKEEKEEGRELKTQIAVSLSDETLTIMKEKCENLEISRNAFMETVAVLECIKNGVECLNDYEINTLIDNFPSKKNCKITKDFLYLQKTLPKNVKLEVLKFFYRVNLLKNIRFSALKQVNFYIRDDHGDDKFLFYYGIDNIKNIDIDDYIKALNISMATYGINNQKSKEYIYIGRMQQYKHATRVSMLFTEICRKLNVDKCDCIKVHYKSINDIIQVLESLNLEV